MLCRLSWAARYGDHSHNKHLNSAKCKAMSLRVKGRPCCRKSELYIVGPGMWKRLKDYCWIGVIRCRHCVQNQCSHQPYKQVNSQLKLEWCNSLHNLNGARAQSKKREMGLENMLHTERIRSSMLFCLWECKRLFSLLLPPKRSSWR